MSELTVWCDAEGCKYNIEGRCWEWNVHIGHNKFCETYTLDDSKKTIFEVEFNRRTSPFNNSDNAEHNTIFLHAVEGWANDQLVDKGCLFLSDVLNELGFDVGEMIRDHNLDPRLGWTLDKNGKVSFGPLTPGIDIPLKFEVIDVYDALRSQ